MRENAHAEAKGKEPVRFIALWLLALLAISACIRIAGVSDYYLNADEQLYYYMAQGENPAQVVRFAMNETHSSLNCSGYTVTDV